MNHLFEKIAALLVGLFVMVVLVGPLFSHAEEATPDQILCRCSTFVRWFTGKDLPDTLWNTDPRIHPGIPHKGDIVLFYFPLTNSWHAAVDVLDDPLNNAFYTIGSNEHGCGLSISVVPYSDPHYAGTFK